MHRKSVLLLHNFTFTIVYLPIHYYYVFVSVQLLFFLILSSVARISTLKVFTNRVVLYLTIAGSVGQ
jgi:hypothetical protein